MTTTNAPFTGTLARTTGMPLEEGEVDDPEILALFAESAQRTQFMNNHAAMGGAGFQGVLTPQGAYNQFNHQSPPQYNEQQQQQGINSGQAGQLKNQHDIINALFEADRVNVSNGAYSSAAPNANLLSVGNGSVGYQQQSQMNYRFPLEPAQNVGSQNNFAYGQNPSLYGQFSSGTSSQSPQQQQQQTQAYSTPEQQYNQQFSQHNTTSFDSLPYLPASSAGMAYTAPAVPQLTVQIDNAGPTNFQGYDGWRDDDISSVFSESDNESAVSVTSIGSYLSPNPEYTSGIDVTAPFLAVPSPQRRRPSSGSLSGLEDLQLTDDASDDGYLSTGSFNGDLQYANIVHLTSPMIHAIPSPSASPIPNYHPSPAQYSLDGTSQADNYPTPQNFELPPAAIVDFMGNYSNPNPGQSNQLTYTQQGSQPTMMNQMFPDMQQMPGQLQQSVNPPLPTIGVSAYQGQQQPYQPVGLITPPEQYAPLDASYNNGRRYSNASQHSLNFGANGIQHHQDMKRTGSPVPPRSDAPPLPKPSEMAIKTPKQTVYKCPYPDCGKTFTRPYNLKSHYRSHTGERPFVCAHCPATFSRKHDLKRHAKLHAGLKPHVCAACKKAFARSDALRRHLRGPRENACAIKIRQMQTAKMEKRAAAAAAAAAAADGGLTTADQNHDDDDHVKDEAMDNGDADDDETDNEAEEEEEEEDMSPGADQASFVHKSDRMGGENDGGGGSAALVPSVIVT